MQVERGLTISGWQKNSCIDYPGKIATVLFFAGCNLRCPFCHNPDIVHNSVADHVGVSEVLDFCRRRRGCIDGVVLSGGEPTLYDLSGLVASLRTQGLSIKLDTNGLRPGEIDRIAPDYLALDVKTTPQRYGPILGYTYGEVEKKLRRALDIVRRMGAHAQVRITAAAGVVDEAAIGVIARMCEGVHTVYLQRMQYHGGRVLDPDFFTGHTGYTDTQLGRFREILSEYVDRCHIR